MANHSGKPIAQHVLDEIAQSPIRGALRPEDIAVLNEVYGGVSINDGVHRVVANRNARGYETNDAMLQQLRILVSRIRN